VMPANIPNAFVQTDIDDKNHIKGQQISPLWRFEDPSLTC
jgi:hypothetical protein